MNDKNKVNGNRLEHTNITKTYFHVNQKVFDLPFDFMASKNEKFIVVQYVAVTYKNFVVGDVCLHSDIVQRDNYCDGFIMLANKRQTKFRKYKFTGNQRRFRLWFTDLSGNEVEPDAFILSMLLIY